MINVSTAVMNKVKKGFVAGMTLASCYTGAYMVTKQSGCSHAPAEDPIMRSVRAAAGAIVGGVMGKLAAAYVCGWIAVTVKDKEDNDGSEDR